MQQRVAQRPRVHAPKEGYVIFDGFPPHAPHFGTLTTDGAEVAVEIVAAVVAMLHLALMSVDKVRLCLLPAAETAVVLSYLLHFFVLESINWWLYRFQREAKDEVEMLTGGIGD